MLMDASLYHQILATGAWVNLSTRAKWRLSGADRVRYLNGQVTNDVRTARADAALHACVTNVKGRIEGDIFIHTHDDSLILDAPEGLRESLGARLEKYIIADDAVLEDITDEWQLWHWMDTEQGAGGKELEGRGVKAERFGLPGYDLWLPASQDSNLSQALSAEDAETFRIIQKVPVWPNELNGDVFPPEAGLGNTAMSYTKGCYIGQEVLSRIKTTGKMPRELVAWEVVGETTSGIATGVALRLADREIGLITSVAQHPVSRRLAGLGFIRQGVAGMDSELLVGDGLASISSHVKISALLNQ